MEKLWKLSFKQIKLCTHIAQLERALALVRIMGSNPIVRPVNIRINLLGLCLLCHYVYACMTFVLLYCFYTQTLQLLMDQLKREININVIKSKRYQY